MKNRALILLLTLNLFVSLLGCSKGQGTSTGNPFTALRFSAYNSSLSEKNVTLAITDIKMCFKRLRLKQSSGSGSSSNVDLSPGEITLSPNGTDIADLVIPQGTFTGIEFDLEDNCGSGSSLTVVNGNGSFASSDHITIKFEGTLVSTGQNESLELAVQQIVSALNTANSNSQLRTLAESSSGSF